MYPLARGLAPVVVLVVTTLALSWRPVSWEGVGVGVVACGVLLVRGVGRRSDARGVLFGVAIAVCIAGYTIVDSYGSRHAGPITYFEVVAIGVAVLYGAGRAPARRGGAPPRAPGGADRGRNRRFGAYVLVLAALSSAPSRSLSRRAGDERGDGDGAGGARPRGTGRAGAPAGACGRRRRRCPDRGVPGRRRPRPTPGRPRGRATASRCARPARRAGYFATREETSGGLAFLRAALFGMAAPVSSQRVSSARTSSRCSAATVSSSPSSTACSRR